MVTESLSSFAILVQLKIISGEVVAVCKKEHDWTSHPATIALGRNHCSIAGSRYSSPYFCLTERNVLMLVDSKILTFKHSSHSDVDEFVRTLLPKLIHIRELAKLNVMDFNKQYNTAYDKKYTVKATSWGLCLHRAEATKDCRKFSSYAKLHRSIYH